MSAWSHFDSGKCDPALNMAIDDLLLQRVAEFGVPVLRFYNWAQPAATFGYFQKIAELEAVTPLRPLIRRPTGGGLVPHVTDWTYCLAVPPSHDWYRLRAEESYRRMHDWIRLALGSLGVSCELAQCCRKVAPGQCFEGYEKFDLLAFGRKIAGAAQRRNRLGLLIQGSIQPTPAGVARERFINAMIEIGDGLFGGAGSRIDSSKVTSLAEDVATSRYRSESFNRRR